MTFSIQIPGFEIEKKEQKCDYEIEPILNGQAQICRNKSLHGRPMKPFFIEIQNFWAWADKLGR